MGPYPSDAAAGVIERDRKIIQELRQQRDDLLAACKAISEILADLEIDCDADGNPWPEVRAMRAAIAKADGK